MRFSLGVAAGTVAVAVALPAGASAATFAVDRLDDPAGPGACSVAPNDCSLNQAVDKANLDSTVDLINLGPGEHQVTSTVLPTEPVNLAGAGARQTTVRSTGDCVINFSTEPGPPSELADMTITGGANQGGEYGGGVRASTPLILRRVAIVGNVDGAHSGTPGLYPGLGGAVYAPGDLTIIDSLIAHNRASVEDNGSGAHGGGLYLGGANNVIRNSTIAENVAEGSPSTPASGGGISIVGNRSLTLENVTLVGNAATGDPTSHGANLSVGPGSTVTVKNSIFARGLPAVLGNCDRPVISGGGNVDDGFECGFTIADRRGVDPLLSPLADNGGPTDTLALGAGSPALDFAGTCGLAADQRGLPRPSGACDSGAFEAVQVVGRPAACRLRISGTAAALKARVTCDAAAGLSIAGVATVKPKLPESPRGRLSTGRRGRKTRPRRVVLRPVTGAAAAGEPVTVTVKLPKSLRRAVKAGRRVSVKLTLTARTSTGAESSQTARVAKVKKPPRKKRARWARA